MDLIRCRNSNEEGYLEMDVPWTVKFKPKRLTLNTFQTSFDWNYFYLETEEIVPPVSVYGEGFKVEVIETSPGKYSSYNDEKNVTGRTIELQLKGNFVLFAKGSFYNSVSSTYDARHNKLGLDRFREYIQN